MTKTISSLTLFLLLAVGVALAAGQGQAVTLGGYIVDNMCAAAHAGDADSAERIKTHPKSCALMPDCVKSGYALLSEGHLYKLDAEGNKQVAELLKKTSQEKGLSVKVEGTLDGQVVHVKSISD
jgi:hypothetical protein